MEMLAEQWRPVVGYEGRYEVSDQGRVRSVRRYVGDFGAPKGSPRLRLFKGRMLSVQTKDGRAAVSLKHERGEPRRRRVHQLVMQAFVGPQPNGMQVAHWDGDALNNRLVNLRYATPKQNAADKKRHGTQPVGERVYSARLTEQDVKDIRMLAGLGVSSREIKRIMRLNVDSAVVRHAIAGRTWQHVNVEKIDGQG